MSTPLKKTSSRSTFVIFAAQILEYYDQGLYSLTAALLFTQFFGDCNPFTALLILFLPFEVISKPLGALFFGKIGDHLGRKKAFFLSLLGMSATTLAISILPTYDVIGITSAVILVICRILQKFCHCGNTGGALLLLEAKERIKKNFLSSLYGATGILGFLLASFSVSILASFSLLETYWRILFLVGSFAGVLLFFLRGFCEETLFLSEEKKEARFSVFEVVKQNFRALFAIIFVCGFSYTTYSLSFVLMNGLTSQMGGLSYKEVLHINTLLLLVDMLLLPLFGLLATKYRKESLMRSAAWTAMIGAIPVFSFLPGASFFTALCLRLFTVIVGVWFSATYYIWAQERAPANGRYTLLSLGKSFGGAIGYAATSISLWLYNSFETHLAPAFYLMLVAGLALFSLSKRTSSVPSLIIKEPT